MRALFVALALAACSGHRVEPAPAADAAVSGPSLYDLPIELREGRFDAQRGHPVLVAMFYGTCPAACPAMIDDLARVLADAPETHVVLVSFDAARDTPDRLAELARIHHLDARWTLAAADEPNARTLAAAIGLKYRRLPDGAFTHSTAIVALDGDGRVIARTDRLNDHDALVRSLRTVDSRVSR
jgi:protein SCO1/2